VFIRYHEPWIDLLLCYRAGEKLRVFAVAVPLILSPLHALSLNLKVPQNVGSLESLPAFNGDRVKHEVATNQAEQVIWQVKLVYLLG